MISIWSYIARYETTSRNCFLDKHESKTNVNRENNKTMYLLKRFYNSTLAVIELLKRTIMSYLKYRWDGSLAEMLRISRSWCAFHGNAPHKASGTVSKQACTVPYALWHSQFNNGQDYKGAGRMPWHQEPKKDAISCEKLRGGANIHWSAGIRMGKPGRKNFCHRMMNP